MPEHKDKEVSENAPEQNGGKQQIGARSNTQSDNKVAPQNDQHVASTEKSEKGEDERTGDGTGARAGEYS